METCAGRRAKGRLAWELSIRNTVFTKRTQLKNADVFRHETVMQKQSWVRYAKKNLKMGGKTPKYLSGRVVLRTNEPKMNPIYRAESGENPRVSHRLRRRAIRQIVEIVAGHSIGVGADVGLKALRALVGGHTSYLPAGLVLCIEHIAFFHCGQHLTEAPLPGAETVVCSPNSHNVDMGFGLTDRLSFDAHDSVRSDWHFPSSFPALCIIETPILCL